MENVILTTYTTEQLTGIITHAVKEAVQILQEGNKKQESEILLTRKEAAELLKISLVTLNDWSKRGLVKSYIIGGRVLYKRKEVEASLGEVKTVKY
jgi:excisionase family DNA binding protein